MPDEQRKNLVRIDECAVAVDRSNTVAVSIGTEAGVVFSGARGLTERFNVRLDRFRVHAAETRVARATNFVAGDAIAPEELRQQTCR